MARIVVWAAFTVFLVFTSTVEAKKVSFWRDEFTMTCPGAGNWYLNGKNVDGNTAQTKELKVKYENNMKGPHHCVYGTDKKYYFYVQGKVCENCFELEAQEFGLAIILDVIVTAILMMVIYKFGKRRSSGGTSNASKAPARPAQPGQSSDYEQLNPNRSKEVYSKLKSRTG